MTNSRHSDCSVFERLHPTIQRWIWRQKWQELRDIQHSAVAPVLAGEDVVIAAPTAAGKTEAAFLPICTSLMEEESCSVQTLMVSPLKALINDQYDRLCNLCDELDIAVHRWHGDVSQSQKKRLRRKPDGILITTPESLESMFVNRGSELKRYFGGLSYVVLDEIHVFMDSERGKQLQSLLWRLECLLDRRIPRIGLSATIGDLELAARFLRPSTPEEVRLIQSKSGEQELKLVLNGYSALADSEDEDIQGPRTLAHPEIVTYLYDRLRSGKHLVFANARSKVEVYADALRMTSEQARTPNPFLPHHGSLSKAIREETETRLKELPTPATAVCTSTLELGIDIGYVESVCQIGVPPSVASLRQRLGRSGRKQGEASVLRFLVEERAIAEDTPPQDCIRARLAHSIAMIELLLEGWCEPPTAGLLHLSTLVQQVMSTVAQFGGAKADELWKLLCSVEPFETISQSDFVQLLRSMGSHDLMVQVGDGSLMLGGKGERIVNHYDFYAAFVSPEEYRIIFDDKTLGSIPITYALTEGQYIIFAGRRWCVVVIDTEANTIEVEPAPMGRAPLFGSGGAMVHDRVRTRMLDIYLGTDVPRYIDMRAVELLAEGRRWFRRLELADNRLLQWGRDLVIFPWIGDRAMNALALMLVREGLRVGQNGVSIVVTDITTEDAVELMRSLQSQELPDPVELAKACPIKASEKYHWCLSEELLDMDYAAAMLDVEGAWRTLAEMVTAPHSSHRLR